MKKTQNNFFNLFDAEDTDITENADIASSAENSISGGQFSFFDNELSENIPEEPERQEKKKRSFFKKKKRQDFFSDEENGYEVSPASGKNEFTDGEFTVGENTSNTDCAETVHVDIIPLTEDAEFTLESPESQKSKAEAAEFAVEDAAPVDAESAGRDSTADDTEFTVENNTSVDSDEDKNETTDKYEDVSVFKHDDATEKMVSILEDDVSSEVIDDEPLNIPPQNRKEKECKDLSGLKNFRDIKKMSVMEKFETPYVYSSKNEDRVRYRLSLPSDKNPRKTRRTRDIISMVITLVAAFLIAMFLRSFVFVFATVDGPSMQPTLQTGEKIFVTRYTYFFEEIERGDIVVCDFPSDYYPDHYVKRVIGLGGEKVSIKNGVVYINGEALPEDYTITSSSEQMDEVVVPEGCVFVMGDNRVNSTDSRKEIIGPVNKKLIIGKARCILYPFSKIGSLEKEN